MDFISVAIYGIIVGDLSSESYCEGGQVCKGTAIVIGCILGPLHLFYLS